MAKPKMRIEFKTKMLVKCVISTIGYRKPMLRWVRNADFDVANANILKLLFIKPNVLKIDQYK